MASMFDTRNRGRALVSDYQMSGADAAADTQGAGAARGLMDPRGGPMNPGQGMVFNPGGGGMFPLANMGAQQHLRDFGYGPNKRGRGSAVPDGDMSMYSGDVPQAPYFADGGEATPTFGGRAAPADPRASMIDWARSALANRRTTGTDEFDAPPMAGLANTQQQQPLMTNMSQSWEAEGLPGGMDPNLMAGLSAEGYDVAGMFRKDGGLSPSGNYLRSAYDYGLRNGMDPETARSQSAMAAGLAKAKVEEAKPEKVDNTDRKAFLDYMGNSDNAEENRNYFHEALTGSGYDTTPLTTTDKEGVTSRTPKFDYMYGQYMRGLMSGKSEEEVLAGMKGLTKKEEAPPKNGAKLVQRNAAIKAAEDRIKDDETLANAPQTDAKWADFKVRRAGAKAQRAPKGSMTTPEGDTREYAPRSQHQDAIDFVRQYGNTRKGQEVAAHLERMGVPVRSQEDRTAQAAVAEGMNMPDIRANKEAYGPWMRNQAEVLQGFQKMKGWLQAGKEKEKLYTPQLDPEVMWDSAGGMGW